MRGHRGRSRQDVGGGVRSAAARGTKRSERVCRPERFRPVGRITQIAREGSGRGQGRYLCACAGGQLESGRRARWKGARGVGGCARARGCPRGLGRRGRRSRIESVPPRQSPAGSLSRAWQILRGSRCAGKRLQEKGGLSSLAPRAAPQKPVWAHQAPLSRQRRGEPLVSSGEGRPVCF